LVHFPHLFGGLIARPGSAGYRVLEAILPQIDVLPQLVGSYPDFLARSEDFASFLVRVVPVSASIPIPSALTPAPPPPPNMVGRDEDIHNIQLPQLHRGAALPALPFLTAPLPLQWVDDPGSNQGAVDG